MHIVRMKQMTLIFKIVLNVHLGVLWRFCLCFKVSHHGSCVEIWRVKCNGKCLKHMADASDCALALFHLNSFYGVETALLGSKTKIAPL